MDKKMIPSDQRSEHSKACCHDSMCLRWYDHLSVLVPPQDTCHHGSWLTDDLNPYSISWLTCSQPNLPTRTSWLQYI